MTNRKRSRKSASEEDSEDAAPSDATATSNDSDYEPEVKAPAPKRQNKENKPPGSNAKDSGKHDQIIQRLRRSLVTSIKAQMVYKKSLKHSSSRINVEIPNLTMADLEGILGPSLIAKASKGPKQVSVTTVSGDLYDMLGCSLTKALRYGASLEVKDEALKFVYSRETQILKATGLCVMSK